MGFLFLCTLRRSRGAGLLRASGTGCLQRLHVFNEAEEALLTDQPLKRRHDRTVALDDLHLRRQDRFTNVRLVGLDGAAAFELHLTAKDTGEARAAPGAVANVAGIAGQLLEQLFAARR